MQEGISFSLQDLLSINGNITIGTLFQHLTLDHYELIMLGQSISFCWLFYLCSFYVFIC